MTWQRPSEVPGHRAPAAAAGLPSRAEGSVRAHRPGRAPSRPPSLSAPPPPPSAAEAAMGLTISSLFSRLFGKKQMRILMGEGTAEPGAVQPSPAGRGRGGRGSGRGNSPVPGCGHRAVSVPSAGGGVGRAAGRGGVRIGVYLPFLFSRRVPVPLPASPAAPRSRRHGEAEPRSRTLAGPRGTKMGLRPGRAGVPGRASPAPRPCPPAPALRLREQDVTKPGVCNTRGVRAAV